jgi:hypothetical protein
MTAIFPKIVAYDSPTEFDARLDYSIPGWKIMLPVTGHPMERIEVRTHQVVVVIEGWSRHYYGPDVFRGLSTADYKAKR